MEISIKVVILAKENTSLKFKKMLESLLSQTSQPKKIVVADLNSANSDYTYGLLEDLEGYSDLSYIHFDESITIAGVYNHFIENTEESHISFLTSNDLWDYNIVTLMIDQFKKSKNVGGAFCNGVEMKENHPHSQPEPFFKKKKQASLGSLLNLEVRKSAQVVYNVKALKSINGFKDGYNIFHHTDTLLRLSKKYSIIALPMKLMGSYSTKEESYESILKDYKKLHQDHIDIFLRSKKANEYYYKRIIIMALKSRLWLNYIFYLLIYFIKYPLKSVREIVRLIEIPLNKMYDKGVKNLAIFASVLKLNKYKKGVLKDKSIKKDYRVNIKTKNLGLKRLIIPINVPVIGKSRYFNKANIEIVEIPNTVLEIKNHAFSNCINLKEVIIHEGSQLKRIGAYAFANCLNLEKINLNPSLHTIKSYAFIGCSKLEEAEFLDDSALTEIEKGAFLGCENLKTLLLTGPIKRIAPYAFAGCHSLNNIRIPKIDGLHHIGEGAFIHCKNLDYFQLSMNMEEIKEKTFYGCKSIKKITVPKSVSFIEKEAFVKCDSLQEVSISNKDIIIAANVFDKHTRVEKVET